MLVAVAEEGLEDIVSWQPHGRSFTVHMPKIFVEKIMSRYVLYQLSSQSVKLRIYHCTGSCFLYG
jgi:hypothetical protein